VITTENTADDVEALDAALAAMPSVFALVLSTVPRRSRGSGSGTKKGQTKRKTGI